MRRSASEILRNLERRVARLEKQSESIKLDLDFKVTASLIGDEDKGNVLRESSWRHRISAMGKTKKDVLKDAFDKLSMNHVFRNVEYKTIDSRQIIFIEDSDWNWGYEFTYFPNSLTTGSSHIEVKIEYKGLSKSDMALFQNYLEKKYN